MMKKNKKIHIKPSIVLTLSVFLATAGIATCSKSSKDNKTKVCLYKISDENVFNDMNLLYGDNITNDGSKIYLIGANTSDKGKNKYLILNDNNEACIAYLDSKYLHKLDGTQIDVGNAEDFIDKTKIATVKNPNGVVKRDKNLKGENLKENKSSLPITGKLEQIGGTLYNEVIDLDKDEINLSLVANNNIDEEYEDKLKRIFVIDTPDKIGLNIRSTPNNKTNDNIITTLDDNTIIFYIKEINEIDSNDVRWAYIGYIDKNEIKYGYIAAKQYNNGILCDFIKEINDKEIILKYNAILTPLNAENVNNKIDIEKLTKSEDNNLKQKVYNNAKEKLLKENKICKKVDLSILKNYNGKLNVRLKPSIDEDIIATINDKEIVYLDSEYEVYKENEISYVKIYLPNGKEGYVDSIYLKDITKKEAIDTNLITNNITIDGKKYSGVYGVDINNCTSYDSFLKILNDGVTTNTYPNMEVKHIIPNYFIFKIGATNYGYNTEFKINEDTYTYANNVKQMMKKCNEENIPFGLYYFSQALNKEEAAKEVEAMKPFIDYIKDTNNKMFKLPLILDIEAFDGYRLTKQNRSKNSETINYEMYLIRRTFGIEPMIYTESNTLTNVIDYYNLEYENTDEMYGVVCNDVHVQRYKDNSIPLDNMVMMQTKVSETGCDIDFLKDYAFERYTNIKK